MCIYYSALFKVKVSAEKPCIIDQALAWLCWNTLTISRFKPIKFSQSWYYWHLEPENSLLWGTALCIPGLYPQDTSSNPPPSCDNWKRLPTLPNLLRAKQSQLWSSGLKTYLLLKISLDYIVFEYFSSVV